MQLTYNISQTDGMVGARADNDNVDAMSFLSPQQAHTYTITVGGTATDGDYVITLPTARGGNQTVTVTRATTPSTNGDLDDALLAALNANAYITREYTITDTSSTVITLALKNYGETFAPTVSAPSPGTLTAANTVHALYNSPSILTPIRSGLFVARKSSGDFHCRVMATGDTAANVVGIAERTTGMTETSTEGVISVSDYQEFLAGNMVSVGRRGRWYVRVETAVTPSSTPYVRIINSATSGTVGALRADSGSSDAVTVASICRFLTTTAAGGIAKVELFIS